MTISISNLTRRIASVLAVATLFVAMGGTWHTVSAAPAFPAGPTSSISTTSASPNATSPNTSTNPAAPTKKSTHKDLAGKLNLNTATEDQLMMLPSVGPAKAERIVDWRKKNGGFKRTADLRHVKGFGYKTFKRLEPFLDIKGDTTLTDK
jgi:competence protein ComEA